MFEQSILVQERTSKPWSVLLSLAAELAGIGLLVLLPLIWAQRMPALSLTKIAVWLPLTQAPMPVHTAPPAGSRVKPSPFAPRPVFVAPASVPTRLIAISDPPPQTTGLEPFATGGHGNVIGLAVVGIGTPGPPPQPMVRRNADVTALTLRIRVSHIEPAKILYQVLPVYPALARTTRTTGTVYLIGVIATDGSIQSLRVLKGHPLLVNAALEAVLQWRFKPTLLNGQPVEVEAPIDVTFTLQ